LHKGTTISTQALSVVTHLSLGQVVKVVSTNSEHFFGGSTTLTLHDSVVSVVGVVVDPAA
jgi:hypothetical protein